MTGPAGRMIALAVALVAALTTAPTLALASDRSPAGPTQSTPGSAPPEEPFAGPAALWPLERGVLRPDGSQPKADTGWPSLTADASQLAFGSYDRRMVEGVRSHQAQVYLRDVATGQHQLVSARRTGNRPGDRGSFYPTVSADGSAVVFESFAANLVRRDTNGHGDVFVRDLLRSSTTLVSATPNGRSGDDTSWEPDVSADGSLVVFTSYAGDLVETPDSGWEDVYLRDVSTGVTTLVSHGVDGSEPDRYSYSPAISDDGSAVVFTSWASNLVAGDVNDTADIFRYDVATGMITLVTRGLDGGQSDDLSVQPEISGDGNRVAFISRATNLVEQPADEILSLFVVDLATAQTFAVDGGFEDAVNEVTQSPVLSYDGSLVAFATTLPRLPRDQNSVFDLYLVSLATDRVTLLSHTEGGRAGGSDSGNGVISADGHTVAFTTTADDLVPDDTNDAFDVIVARDPAVP